MDGGSFGNGSARCCGDLGLGLGRDRGRGYMNI